MGTNEQDTLGALEHLISLLPSHDADSSASSSSSSARRSRVFFGPRLRVGRRDGVCQCGVGYAGNRPIDPTACAFSCAPEAVPESVAFLREPNVTVGAS